MPRRVPDDPGTVTDEQIGQAIQRAADYLYAPMWPADHPERYTARSRDPAYDAGVDCLAVYALLQAGMAIHDERFDPRHDQAKWMIEGMKRFDLHGQVQTYARGIRATALALYNRPEDREALKADAYWLICVCDGGAYTYTYPDPPGLLAPAAPRRKAESPDLADSVARILGTGSSSGGGGGQGEQLPATTQPDYSRPREEHAQDPGALIIRSKKFNVDPRGAWDNSNSQYGALGVWSAADAGIEVPRGYWLAVDRHWDDWQDVDGHWMYSQQKESFRAPPCSIGLSGINMTCAGLATMMVMVAQQAPDGHWVDADKDRSALGGEPGRPSEAAKLIETAYCLLFLSRGRHPILMAKLRFDGILPPDAVKGLDAPAGVKVAVNAKPSDMWMGYWANRPRDAANLARFASRQLERQFNWETLNIDRDWTQWTDAPVLELASHTAPRFTEAQIEKLRNYVLAGGLLFTHADGSSPQFNKYAATLAHQLFPQYELVDVPAGHPLYTNDTVYNVNPRPTLKMVTNGSRVLMVHSPTDITRWWQMRDDVRHRAEFGLGVNLFVYAAGKQDFRNRLQEAWVPQPAARPLDTLKLARVSYAGNWSPEPFAWQRYGNWLQRQTGTWIETYAVPVAQLGTLDPAQIPIAHLTGTARHDFTAADAAQVRDYVQRGGVLLVDMCGGMGSFDASAEALLAAAFPGQTPQPLPLHHPLLKKGNPGTEDVTHPQVRAETLKRYGKGVGSLRYLACGKGHVLYTPLDITSGLLGVRTLGILGYEPGYAEAMMKNIIFWTLDGQNDR